jgi:hypothetical protein
MKMLSFLRRHKVGGFTLAESVMSLGIGTVAIVGGMTLSQHELKLVKSVRQTNAASHALEERIEQLRLVNWRQMTDAAHLSAQYFPNHPASAHALPGVTERVTVSAFPDAAACTPLIMETNEAGVAQIVSAGAGFENQRLARVNVRVKWVGAEGKTRVRELASVISNAGINATSLPAFGTDGTNPAASETTTSQTTTTGTTTTSTETTTTQTATTTETTGNNGNGNGRGNVAGKSGTK